MFQIGNFSEFDIAHMSAHIMHVHTHRVTED